MRYIVEESLYDFKAWAGGEDTLNDLLKYEAEEYINILFEDSEELPTRTKINDILWFERGEIYKYCGIYKAVYGVTDEEEEE